MEAIYIVIIVLIAVLAVLSIRSAFRQRDDAFRDTMPCENDDDALAFPGTSDTRTVREVDDYIKACNAANAAQRSNLGENL